MEINDKTVTDAELLKRADSLDWRKLVNIQPEWKHPRVKWDRKNLSIELIEGRYPIWLPDDSTTGHILDTIFQIASKSWADNALIGELVDAYEHASWDVFGTNAQGIACPCGRHMKIDWQKRKFKPLRT